MKQHRLIVDDQVLIEAEPDLARQPQRRVDAVDAGGDFVDASARFVVRDHCAVSPVESLKVQGSVTTRRGVTAVLGRVAPARPGRRTRPARAATPGTLDAAAPVQNTSRQRAAERAPSAERATPI